MSKELDVRDAQDGPPEAWQPLQRIVRRAWRPLELFLQIEASSGILLLLCAAAALLWANSPAAESYHRLWQLPLGLRIGPFELQRTLEWLVNDVLMVLFFFVVGLEIRREIHCGVLSSPRRAALPACAALGGMLVPALIYLSVAGTPDLRRGWGIPTATDIAFAVGIVTMLGSRVPATLRVLLLALAVIDDLGAILVIAVFYSSSFAWTGLGVAAIAIASVMVMQRAGVRTKLAYLPPAVALWAGVYSAGVHPTIAGVALGLLTPVRAWLGASGFEHELSRGLHTLGDRALPDSDALEHVLERIGAARRETLSPAEALIHALHPWVAFLIMPVFALANAGLTLPEDAATLLVSPVLWGVTAGLALGKPIGVLLACWSAKTLGIATLPTELGTRHLVQLGLVAGVGFTMALFVAPLAFAAEQSLAAAKLGVLVGSGLAACAAYCFGRYALEPERGPVVECADDAERVRS